MEIVVTGGSGFLGYHLLNHPAFQDALAIGRTMPSSHRRFQKLSFKKNDDLACAFHKKDVVVHAAGRAHVIKDKSKNPLDEFRLVNTFGTLNLAEQAAIAGVKRFIFISTIKVLGKQTALGQTFQHNDPSNPQDPYSVSKLEAEEGLKVIGKAYGMEIVIIRPPLVYGQGVKGNFANLMKLCRLPILLPLGSLHNKRSLVSAENLVDLIVVCLDQPNAKNKTFLVSDGDDMSTCELLEKLLNAGSYHKKVVRFPPEILKYVFYLIGRQSMYERLSGSLQVDIKYTTSELAWSPPFKVSNSLEKCWKLDCH